MVCVRSRLAVPLVVVPVTVAVFVLLGAQAAFGQNETVVATPEHAPFGASVSVAGDGWFPDFGPVSIYADRPSDFLTATPLATTDPQPDGTIETSFDVGGQQVGPHELYACQRCGDVDLSPDATASFTVDPPSFQVGEGSGNPGATYPATGQGWNPVDGPVSIYPSSDVTAAPLVEGITLFDNGTFAMDVALPSDASPGAYELYACQRCGDVDASPSAIFPFTVVVQTTTGGPTTESPVTTGTGPTTGQPITTGPGVTTGGQTTGAGESSGAGLPIVLGLLLLVLVAVVVAMVVASRRPTARRRRPEWERRAEALRRTDPCDGKDPWYCHRGDPDLKPALRHVSSARAVFPSADVTDRAVELERQTVEAVDGAMRALAREEEAALELRTAASRVWDEFARDAGGDVVDVALELDVQGSSASLPYSLHHCERQEDGRGRWVERATWTGSIQDQAAYWFPLWDPSQSHPTTAEAWKGSIEAALRTAMQSVLRDSVFHRAQVKLELTIEDPGSNS